MNLMKRLFCILCILISASVSLYAQKNLELPKTKSDEIIVHHTGHVLSYNPKWMIPNWVAYELKAEELEGDAQRARSFTPDPVLKKYPRAEHWHYTNSGWVRGHMIPAGDLKYDQKAMDDSFYTSNVCPMNMTFNNSIWKKLEEKARKWAVEFGHIYIITGPVMGENINGKVGESDIMIPDQFFKAILVPYKGSYVAVAFLMDNSETTQGKLRDFAMTVDDLEHIIGMDLFVNLDNFTEKRIEQLLPLKPLGLY